MCIPVGIVAASEVELQGWRANEFNALPGIHWPAKHDYELIY